MGPVRQRLGGRVEVLEREEERGASTLSVTGLGQRAYWAAAIMGKRSWACARGLREVGSTAGPRKEKEKQAEQAFGLAMRGVLSISKFFFYFVFKTNFKCKPNQIQIEF